MGSKKNFEALETGIFSPNLKEIDKLRLGEVGYIATGLKNLSDCRVGETITFKEDPSKDPLKGYESAKPMVYSGLYPTDGDEYPFLRDALGKLQLNDASFVFEPESSGALGFGFRCGFLGMLHLEIIQQRLEREFGMSVITTVPNVSYHAFTRKNPTKMILVNNPSDIPDPSILERVEEPYIKASIITKSDYIGNVITLCIEKRGKMINQTYLTQERVEIIFELPLAEIVFDFYDRLKTVSKGYASFDYSPIGFNVSKLVRVDILLNGNACLLYTSPSPRD